MTKPLRVSWSAIRTHEECHQKSWLLRSGKRAKVSNIRNFFHGIVVDKIMREWLDQPLHTTGAMERMVSDVMAQMEAEEKDNDNIVRWRNAADREELSTFCTELVRRLEPILREHVLPYTYEHGKWFKVPMVVPGPFDHDDVRQIVLTGEMDLIVNNSGPVVWDLKGTADDQYWRKVVAQLTFYDIAVWWSSGVKTNFVGLIQPMCKEPVLRFTVTDQDRNQMLSRIVAYAHDVWREEKSCKDGSSGCNFCDVRHACTRYSQTAVDVFGELADGLRTAAKETP